MFGDSNAVGSILDLIWHYVGIFMSWPVTQVALAVWIGFGIAEYVLGSTGRAMDALEDRQAHSRMLHALEMDQMTRTGNTSLMDMPPVEDLPRRRAVWQ
ncbi:hypothetical protein CCP3SC15_1720007 [Gammaproteobacteria bacterium]